MFMLLLRKMLMIRHFFSTLSLFSLWKKRILKKHVPVNFPFLLYPHPKPISNQKMNLWTFSTFLLLPKFLPESSSLQSYLCLRECLFSWEQISVLDTSVWWVLEADMHRGPEHSVFPQCLQAFALLTLDRSPCTERCQYPAPWHADMGPSPEPWCTLLTFRSMALIQRHVWNPIRSSVSFNKTRYRSEDITVACVQKCLRISLSKPGVQMDIE